MIILGSRALNVYHALGERAEKADYDVIMSVEDFFEWQQTYKDSITSLMPRGENKYKAIVSKDGNKTQYEIELGLEGTSSKFLLDNIDDCSILCRYGFFGEEYRVLRASYQFLTKKSHIVYPVHWEKNISDYHILKGFVDSFKLTIDKDTQKTYFELRRNEAKERFKKFKTPKLNVTNEDFFSSKLAVERFFIHDDIHEMVKHHDRPVYEMMKRDFNMAKCEKDMFFQLPYDYQIQCVQEEAYTIALERYIVPRDKGWEDFKDCFHRAVKRICTTLCSGWFREFAYENYPTVMERYDKDFVKKFMAKVDNGEIKTVENKSFDTSVYGGYYE